MIKLIISDIDGTLVPEGSVSLNPEYFTVIKALKEKGVQFVAASGRNVVSLRKVFLPVADDIWMFSQNGSVIIKKDDIMVPRPIPKEWIRELWTELSTMEEADGIINCPTITYAPDENSQMFHIMKDNYGYNIESTKGWDKIPDVTCSMLTLFHKDNAEKYYDAHLNPIWKERLQYLVSGETWCDLVMPGNGKGAALSYLMDKLDIKPEEVIAFGDNLNDMSMLELAGTAICVNTARDQVKAICKKIVPNYEEDGVLAELKKILASLS